MILHVSSLKWQRFVIFETGNSEEKHMICVYLIFDINNNLMFEACFVLEPCNFSILFLGNIMNIDTRMLYMYTCTKVYLV